jgi:azurin
MITKKTFRWLFTLSLTTFIWHIGVSQQMSAVTTIRLNAVAGLQFDLVRFHVKPGAAVKIVLENKDDMSHNMLITKPGARMDVVNAAMRLEEKGPQMDFIPDMPEVLWSIPVLAPGETKSVTFTAPRTEGVYPYVCTFPGHGFFMFGAMYVSSGGTMPDLASDENIPEPRRKNAGVGKSSATGHPAHATSEQAHPYKLTPPYLYRAYMEDASPASIAVHLPGNLSYCWDASTCELRYAWTGDFVDNTGLWKGKPNAVAKVLGEKFFTIKARNPLRTGNVSVPVSQYKGYRLVDRYPEFHYTVNGVDVYELIKANDDGTALIRTFRIPHATGNVWFVKHPSDGVVYESSSGTWQSDRVKISGPAAGNFTITMIKKEASRK